MGKNRKPRNVVDQMQMQNCSIIETDNHYQGIPNDFLTSDDFCVVQKRRGSKKTPDIQSDAHRSRSNSGKNFNCEGGDNCHMSFWTCKSSACVIDATSIISNDSSQSSNNKFDDVPQSSDFHLNICHESNVILDLDSDVSNESKEKIIDENIFTSDASFKDDKNLCIENVKSVDLSNSVSTENISENGICNEVKITENVVCHAKKKNKKKDLGKKENDDEVERLLKELESDKHQLSANEHATCDFVKCASDFCFDQNCQHFECNGKSNVNIKLTEIALNTKCESKLEKLESESNFNICDLSIDLKNVNKDNPGIDCTLESILNSKEVKTTSQKRKEKRAKAKLKSNVKGLIENDESSGSSPSNNLNIQIDNVEISSSSCRKEEILIKSKNAGESDKKSKKRPSKKQLAIIHEALKKAKEEEERLRKEEEARQKMAEEAERIRQEKLRLEQEKKEKKKMKEKQRRDKMKAEGRLLSKSQKQSRARMEATLAAFRQQGIDVPQICDKKPNGSHGPRLGSCKNFHRKRLDSCQSTQSSDSAVVISERQKCESFSSQESSGKESLSDLPSSVDSTDDCTLMSESDKGIFSYSEESDALDDKTLSNSISKKIISTCKTLNEKCLESVCETNSVKLRSPVVCVLGHVDTGKTKILDFIRKTHVQNSEAGGITQQIGATMIPHNALREKCIMVKDFSSFDLKIPGLLVIDTPGHESFSNLRSRGSSICDIAVLVVDIMHGLEPQTIESINLLKKGKTPFVVALNKIDRIYGWKSAKDIDVESTIKNQSQTTQAEFHKLCQEVILQFANQCLNAALYYENKDSRSYVSMIPTSAITGDGMGNILSTVTQLTQSLMQKKLIYSDELEATVLEVKAIPGLGTTIDVILVNGRLQEGDTIVLAGQEGPIVGQIRSLLMPQPLKELRVKNPYIEYKSIEGAQGIKITGKDLDKSLAGLPLLVAHNHSMIDTLKDEINRLFHDAINSIHTSERGVYVQASTLGSLEALLEFLTTSGIPYFNVKIGPVVKKDVVKASIMLEHDVMYAAILAFDVKIERDAQELADSLGVHIFHADIIYHLFDMYVKYKEDLLSKRHEEIRRLAVFPCKLRVLPEFIFSPRDPIVLGVHVEDGTLREGTPLCVASRDIVEIGIVSSIEVNNSKVGCAKKGEDVCIKIDPKPGESPKTYGKHFSHDDLLLSRISRQSIDTCKEHCRSELQSSDWHLMVELKKLLHIV